MKAIRATASMTMMRLDEATEDEGEHGVNAGRVAAMAPPRRGQDSVHRDQAPVDAGCRRDAPRSTFFRIAQGIIWWCSGMCGTSSSAACSASGAASVRACRIGLLLDALHQRVHLRVAVAAEVPVAVAARADASGPATGGNTAHRRSARPSPACRCWLRSAGSWGSRWPAAWVRSLALTPIRAHIAVDRLADLLVVDVAVVRAVEVTSKPSADSRPRPAAFARRATS